MRVLANYQKKKSLVQEYNPEIRIDQITKVFETCLSLLSMSFGYGTKKYTFENSTIKTATEYLGNRQDAMQELNKQRFEAEQYIRISVRLLYGSRISLKKPHGISTKKSV